MRFYAPVHFKGIKNLPTTLARIISILKYCKPKDFAEQWECITQLSLQQDGAIFAMTDGLGSAEECQLVLPEMLATATEYEPVYVPVTTKFGGFTFVLKYGYRPGKSLMRSEDFLVDKKLDQAELDKQFYRYLAHQKFRRPIRDYRLFVKDPEVLKWSGRAPVTLYQVLAQSTSKAENYLSIESLTQDQLNELWQGYLTQFEAASTMMPSL